MAAFYPLKKFEYTDHQASVREIIVNGVNDIKEGLSKLHDMLNGDSNTDTSQTKEALKDKEIYPVISNSNHANNDKAVISTIGSIINEDQAKEIIENSDYRMTIQSTERFFDWCSGSSGTKEILLLILLITKAILISTASQLCNTLFGTSI